MIRRNTNLRILVSLLALASVDAFAKDSLSIGMSLEPPHLDPTAGSAGAIDEVVYRNVFEGLTRIDRDGHVQPALSKSWKIDEDGLGYTFELRTDVVFHDGAKFDCSDVEFSFTRAMAKDSVNAQKRLFSPIKDINCISPNQVKITLNTITSTFLESLAWGDAVIVDPASSDNNKTAPNGTGLFKFKRWVKGDRITLDRNEQYWGKLAGLKSVTFRFISDPSAATASLMSGDLDAYPNLAVPEILPVLKSNPDLSVHVGTTEGETILALNNASKPLGDIRVRRAITHAINRPALLRGAMFDMGALIGSHVSPHNPGYVDLSKLYDYDISKAKSLLVEAGYPDGFSVRLFMPPRAYSRRSGEIIAAQLAQVGIKVELIPVEWAQWIDQVFKRSDFEMTVIAHTEPADIEIYARDKYYFNYENTEFKGMYQQYLQTVSKNEANQLFEQMQRKLADDSVNVFLFQLAKIGVWNSSVNGLWKNSPIQANDLADVLWDN
ncbi:ABC transporter substrate-binding protein [Vibrio nigripulchritudo]|uniref:ABC transporter substrate-binding protein n=1 Tax=Vibrio nigripulchritudo TaxID=28173 RepID=UPI0003B1D682|nr:ABC transporter substrate-binding protein [Vibrio nigripulchritudo]CCN83811.1 putative ABC-type dipeptide transport system,periplasmic component [Vibrio nigripulchritudo BLFn1]CCN94537.1 putative ABC-type dipeptide transport system,periplasmic component [Vibrio nigripulchritudo ENn2]CCO54976.1 putative ABC-type dipeptide transport system,periplasmic component [Vibrio nigripulchritudo Wn13]